MAADSGTVMRKVKYYTPRFSTHRYDSKLIRPATDPESCICETHREGQRDTNQLSLINHSLSFNFGRN